MTAAEFFVAVYDWVDAQDKYVEAYQKKESEPDNYNSCLQEEKRLRDIVKAELHRCDDKSQKTFYLLAKEKIQRQGAMNKLKNELGAERI